MPEISRRKLLTAGVGVAAGVAAGATVGGSRALAAVPAFSSTPFAMGVASGDAFTTSICLWTRLAPDPVQPGFGMDGQPDTMTVHWRIALTSTDLGSDSTSVAYGDFNATRFDAHSVHVIASNLTPGTHYVYQFYYTEPNGTKWTSPMGYTRTTPAHSSTETCRFVVISCQTFGHRWNDDDHDGKWVYSKPRYFNGYNYMVDNNSALDIDFVVHVGDYIYADPQIDDDEPTCETLEDYRRRYAKYRMRRDNLRELHRLKPFYVSPDDHEWWNNCHGGERNYSNDTVGSSQQPFSRFNAAIRAYWENMPLRYRPDYDSATGLRFAYFNRSFQWGSVMHLHLLDTRQFRTFPTSDPNDSSATMLGTDPYPDHSHHPRQDLLDSIHNSTATFTCIASQVPMGRIVNNNDKWIGYPYERRLVTDALATTRANGTTPNSVVVSGDIHVGVVGQVANQDGTAMVATEYVGPPMTSGGSSTLTANGSDRLEVITASDTTTYNGFMLCEVTADHFDATYYGCLSVTDSTSPVNKICTWRRVPGTIKPTRL